MNSVKGTIDPAWTSWFDPTFCSQNELAFESATVRIEKTAESLLYGHFFWQVSSLLRSKLNPLLSIRLSNQLFKTCKFPSYQLAIKRGYSGLLLHCLNLAKSLQVIAQDVLVSCPGPVQVHYLYNEFPNYALKISVSRLHVRDFVWKSFLQIFT